MQTIIRTFVVSVATILLLLAATDSLPGDEPSVALRPVKVAKVSSLSIEASQVGDGWTGPTGLVIDDFNDVSGLTDAERREAEVLIPALSKEKITGCADFTYSKKSFPISDQVTLRAFVFDSPQSAAAWWKKKYEHDGWEAFYVKVDGVGDAAVDSKEVPKRAVLRGNVWLTCHQLKEGDEYKQLVTAFLQRIDRASK